MTTTAQNIPRIDPAELASSERTLLHARKSSAQADVYRVTWRGLDCVLKDYGASPGPMRRLWGRMTLRREARALAALAGVPGIPALHGWVGPDALLIKMLPALPISKIESPPPPEFFDRAEALIRQMRARGVAHGDIRRHNILAGEGGPNGQSRSVYLIDFASAMIPRPGLLGAVERLMFGMVADADLFHIVKIKAGYHPDALTEAQREILANPPASLSLGRFFRKRVYRYKKARHRKRLWKSIRRRLKGKA